MLTSFEYLGILLVFLFVTLYVEKHYRLRLYDNRLERLIVTIFFFVISIGWDALGTVRSHWAYRGGNNSEIYFGPLPIEEYLFAIIVPYFIITMYVLLRKKIR